MHCVRLFCYVQGLLAFANRFATAADVVETAATILDRDSFDGHLQQRRRDGRSCLIMFHVDWCKVCQKTFPKFAAAADKLVDSSVKMDFAHVDCTNDKTLCQRFDVQGYPTLKLFNDKENEEPRVFRGVRTEDGFVRYAERMMRNAILSMGTSQEFEEAMIGETFAAVVIEAASIDSVPAGIVDAAEKWRDRHVFAVVPKLSAVLGISDVPAGSTVSVVSIAAQQWKGANKNQMGIAAVRHFEGDFKNSSALVSWFEHNRFPGVWQLTESTFFEFTRSLRPAVSVVVDPDDFSDEREKYLRRTAEQLRDEFVFGVVDGVSWADSLSDFNIKKPDLPRILVTEDNFEAWYEDIEGLRVETMESDLRGLRSGSKQLLRQSRSVISRLRFYWREFGRYALQLYHYSQRGSSETALAAAAVVAGLAALMIIGWCFVACCRVICDDGTEFSPPHHKRD